MNGNELEVLLRISSALSSTNNRQEVLHLLVQETAEVVGSVVRSAPSSWRMSLDQMQAWWPPMAILLSKRSDLNLKSTQRPGYRI
jgi:hypothetical protein